MNSPKFINYELRPHKFTERKMLLASLLKICNHFGDDYQYIGFGGIAFTDFKMFHKELNIEKLISVEGGSFTYEKLKFNSPYSFIKIIKANSTEALSNISLTQKSLVWLDYDGALDNIMFDDLRILFSKLPAGSIYIMTCNRELKSKESGIEYTKEEFKELFGDIVPFEIENTSFSSENNYKTTRKMLSRYISKILKEREIGEESLDFHQLYNILYQEFRGAKMFTFGGILTDKGFKIDDIGLSKFEFISNNEKPYKIEIPNLTRKEFDLVSSHLNYSEEELLNLKVVNESDLKKYKKSYKYVPHFYDIRL